jgi:hypothetical protein
MIVTCGLHSVLVYFKKIYVEERRFLPYCRKYIAKSKAAAEMKVLPKKCENERLKGIQKYQ